MLRIKPFVALRPSAMGVAALGLVSLSYVTGLNLGAPGLDNFAHPGWVRPVEYGGIAVAGAVAWARPGRKARAPKPVAPPVNVRQTAG